MTRKYEKFRVSQGMNISPAEGACAKVSNIGQDTRSDQMLTINTSSIIMTVSDVNMDLRSANLRMRSVMWMRPRTSMSATGPAFSEAWRLRLNGKTIFR